MDFFYDNKELAQKIDAAWFIDNDFWTSVKAGVRFTQRSSNRTRQSQQTQTWPGFSGTDLEDYLLATPGDFFSFNNDGSYLNVISSL